MNIRNVIRNVIRDAIRSVIRNSALCKLSCDSRFQRALLHAFAFSKYLPWLVQTSVITWKTQTHAVNAR